MSRGLSGAKLTLKMTATVTNDLTDGTPVTVFDPDCSIRVNAPECFAICCHSSSVHRSYQVSKVETRVRAPSRRSLDG